MTPLGGVPRCGFVFAALPLFLCSPLFLSLVVLFVLFLLFLFVLFVLFFFAVSLFFLALLLDWSGFSLFLFAISEDFVCHVIMRYMECSCVTWRTISQSPC